MVSFQCHACGDVVKKPKLDTHRGRCHSGFDCIDCHTTFNNPGEYKSHTSCISEAEKYQKGLYKGPKTGQDAAPTHAPRNNYPPPIPAAPIEQSYGGRGGYGGGRTGAGWGRPQRVSVTGANDTPLGTPPPTPATNGAPKVWGAKQENGTPQPQATSTPTNGGMRTWGKKEEPPKGVTVVEAPKLNGAGEDKKDKKRKSVDTTTESVAPQTNGHEPPSKKHKVYPAKDTSDMVSEKRKEKKAKKEKKANAADGADAAAESSEGKKNKKSKRPAAPGGDSLAVAAEEERDDKSKKRKLDDMKEVDMDAPAPVKQKKKSSKPKKDDDAAAMDVDLPPQMDANPSPAAKEKKKKSSKKDKQVASREVDTPALVDAKEARKKEKREKREKRRPAGTTATEA